MEYIKHLASGKNMSAEQTSAIDDTPAPVETSTPEPVSETPVVEESAENQEELMKLVIDQENELGSTKTALEKAEAELRKLQSQWKEREDNEKLQTKSKAEALSKALVDSWTAALPADMMTDENKKAIYAMAQNFPEQSVKMMEIAHKASKKYKQDIADLKSQQQASHKRDLESRVSDIITKKRRVQDTTSVVHAASTKVMAKVANPFGFNSSKTSSSMNSIRSKNPDLFAALKGFSSGNLRDRMGQIANISGNSNY
jgi:DNA repair exonuclease SbcCD ATPase subunit